MSRKKAINFSFDNVFIRVSSETDLRNIVQLADFLEVTQSAVSQMKKKKIFPLDWAYKISKAYNLNLNWLTEGKEAKNINDKVKENLELDFLKDLEKWILEEAKEDSKRLSWLEIELQEKFPRYAEWKRKNCSGDTEDSVPQGQKIA